MTGAVPGATKVLSRRDQVRSILTGETYGTVLLVLFADEFGLEALHWHPMTIAEALSESWNVQIPQVNLDKLMAAVTIVTTDLFFKSVTRFIDLCNVLSGDSFDPAVFNPADSSECAWGCTEALLLDPPDREDPEPFNDEIRYYITEVLKEEGFVSAPDILKIAIGADFSAKVSYDFADDPELFSAIYSVQSDRTKEIEDMIRENLLELFSQLKALPLKNGDSSAIEQRLAQMVRSLEQE